MLFVVCVLMWRYILIQILTASLWNLLCYLNIAFVHIKLWWKSIFLMSITNLFYHVSSHFFEGHFEYFISKNTQFGQVIILICCFCDCFCWCLWHLYLLLIVSLKLNDSCKVICFKVLYFLSISKFRPFVLYSAWVLF